MKTLHLIAGTPEWHAHRATHFNASDAPAMLGCSPYMTRAELLRRLHTGVKAEVDAGTQRRFNDGHRFEALARPLAEEIIGDALAPVVGTLGELSASFDGLTLMGDTAFEHKTMNEELRAVLFGDIDPDTVGDLLPKHYRVQMEQQLLVSGAERVLFMASKWEGDALVEERHCWYYPNPPLRAEIVAGWRQFATDLAEYKPTAAELPKPTGRAPESLPALRIEITGAVTASNLAEFKETALGAIRSVNRELTTDAHFADAEQAVKWCGEVESRIKAAKDHALSQTATIESLFRTLDEVSAEARRVRLDLEKLVTARKAAIKLEIVQEGKAAYEAHEAALRAECGCWTMLPQPDFAGCIKNLRTVDSIRNAVQTTLANAKIRADESARTIRAALAALDEESKGHEHLFHDRLNFINMIPEAVRLMVRDRIAKHKEAEQARAAELAEQERERIRAEEVARLEREREAARQAEAIQAAKGRAIFEGSQPAAAPVAAPASAPQAPAANSPNVVPMQRAAPASPPTLKLGEINARIAPLSIDVAGLAQLGFPHAAAERSAKLYHEADFGRMVDSLVAHLRTVQAKQLEAA